MMAFFLIIFISGWDAFATFNEKGMLPMDTQWFECKQGGPSIQCKTEECVAQCKELLQNEENEKAAQREEVLQNVLDDALKVEEPEKNPALFQLK
jgi:hypothetical protein